MENGGLHFSSASTVSLVSQRKTEVDVTVHVNKNACDNDYRESINCKSSTGFLRSVYASRIKFL